MTNEKEKLAREWAESKLAMPTGHLDADVLAAADHILATTTEPTMDEVEWNGDTHALTGAVVDVGGGPVDVVMLAGSVDGIDYATLDGKFGYEPRYYFTPNGKKYELREVTDKPEHPETLRTLEDYENAPEGTIAASNGKWEVPYMKQNGLWWHRGIACSNEHMARNCHPVVREGWGE